jgi:hypothetical protein
MLLALLLCSPAKGANVVTQHNDPARTGANLEETILTPAKVKSGFGKVFSRHVNGQIYAQPLVVSGVEIPGKGIHNVVYVATMENNVYAFDADDRDHDHYLWKANLGKPVPYTAVPWPFVAAVTGYNIKPAIGITSTPVIDPVEKRMWVVAKTYDDSRKWHYNLFCLDITTGETRGRSQEIEATDPDGVANLRAETALQRPALLLANGMIYLAFGAHQDAILQSRTQVELPI